MVAPAAPPIKFSPGTLVLAGLSGFRSWPGVLCDEDTSSYFSKPKHAKGDVCVHFFGSGDVGW
jgi:hypothetical protein